jgi:hypothetical protein
MIIASSYYIFDASTEKFLGLKRLESGDSAALWHVWDDKMIANGELTMFACFIEDVQSIEELYSYIEESYSIFLGLIESKMDDIYIIPCYFRKSDGKFILDFSEAYR